MTTTRKSYFKQAVQTVLIVSLSVGLLSACGNGANNNATDSTGVNGMDSTINTLPSDTTTMRDTAPGSEIPPGAINPGEDSARYGNGANDSSKNRRGGK
ncbi:hypothetical protein KTO58_09715 [Chitinophaga pendula]|uniref:hypothetical protein n=1 Tax=Chitinophaga TaxID=79328 RepID=UPI000BAEBD7C|nr:MULTISPECIES: hypothetical protein [Chitinophaga]ASZ12931.1 hypothetical protein CK934_19190 [Chitinophaga sp. MD30]UCJ09441.1 hypothetical protein KTO58_09715 [Chitinophaga pendula]